jgi:hypothetical protein
MDGVTSSFEGESTLSGGLADYAKKAMPVDRIAELRLISRAAYHMRGSRALLNFPL